MLARLSTGKMGVSGKTGNVTAPSVLRGRE
jgi:hypothetical protein